MENKNISCRHTVKIYGFSYFLGSVVLKKPWAQHIYPYNLASFCSSWRVLSTLKLSRFRRRLKSVRQGYHYFACSRSVLLFTDVLWTNRSSPFKLDFFSQYFIYHFVAREILYRMVYNSWGFYFDYDKKNFCENWNELMFT
jgi:hypothetical protein